MAGAVPVQETQQFVDKLVLWVGGQINTHEDVCAWLTSMYKSEDQLVLKRKALEQLFSDANSRLHPNDKAEMDCRIGDAIEVLVVRSSRYFGVFKEWGFRRQGYIEASPQAWGGTGAQGANIDVQFARFL